MIAIFDDNAIQVMEYQYDPWGTMEDTLGKLNPLRYRGYVYDEETGRTICGADIITRSGVGSWMRIPYSEM